MRMQNWSLMILCSLSGLVMVTGSFLLLWNRLASLGGDGKGEAQEINILDKIKFKTNYPILVMFFFGALLLAFPVYSSVTACVEPARHHQPLARTIWLKGKLGERVGDLDVNVLAIVKAQPAQPGREIKLSVPYVKDGQYFIRYVNSKDTALWLDEPVSLEEDRTEYPLLGVDWAKLASRKTEVAQKQFASQDEVGNFK